MKFIVLELGARGHFVLSDGENVVGRHRSCDVQLGAELDSVSRRHVALIVDGKAGLVAARDLGSTNGTYLNGLFMSGTRKLEDGDVLALGQVLCTVRLVDRPRQWLTCTRPLAVSDLQRSELRKTPRTGTEVPIRYASPLSTFIGVTANLSERGLFVAGGPVDPVGTPCHLALLPGGTPLVAEGVVRHCVEVSTRGHPPGVGIELSGFDEPAWRWLRQEGRRPSAGTRREEANRQ
jgi:hypothetical protein